MTALRRSGMRKILPGRLLLHANVLDLEGAELRTQLERRRFGRGPGRPHRLAVDLVLDLRANNDDLKSVPFAFLDLLVLLIARNDVELGAAQEQVVVALRSRLEVELEVDILAEFPGGLDVQVPLDGRIVHQLALDDLETAVVGFGLAS